MRITVGAAVVAAVALLGGCGAPVEGTVTEKEYVEGYDSTSQSCHTTTTGGKFPRTTTQCRPVTIWIPECYELDVEQADGTETDVCVDESTWDKTKVGDYYKESK